MLGIMLLFRKGRKFLLMELMEKGTKETIGLLNVRIRMMGRTCRDGVSFICSIYRLISTFMQNQTPNLITRIVEDVLLLDKQRSQLQTAKSAKVSGDSTQDFS